MEQSHRLECQGAANPFIYTFDAPTVGILDDKIKRRTKRSPTIAIDPEDIKAVIQDVEKRQKISELEKEVERLMQDIFKLKFESEETWKRSLLCDYHVGLIRNANFASLEKGDETLDEAAENRKMARDLSAESKASDGTMENRRIITRLKNDEEDSSTLIAWDHKCVDNSLDHSPTRNSVQYLKGVIEPLMDRVYIPVRSNDFTSCLMFFEKNIEQNIKQK